MTQIICNMRAIIYKTLRLILSCLLRNFLKRKIWISSYHIKFISDWNQCNYIILAIYIIDSYKSPADECSRILFISTERGKLVLLKSSLHIEGFHVFWMRVFWKFPWNKWKQQVNFLLIIKTSTVDTVRSARYTIISIV